MLGFGGLHITIRMFFWICTFRSANLSNCNFFSANYSKEKISEAVRCFPAFSLKRTNSYIWVLLSGNKEIEARRTSTTARTSSENIILRFRNHFFVTCLRCPQTREHDVDESENFIWKCDLAFLQSLLDYSRSWLACKICTVLSILELNYLVWPSAMEIIRKKFRFFF